MERSVSVELTSQDANESRNEDLKKEQNGVRKLIDEEEVAEGSVGLNVYVRYFMWVGWFLAFLIVLFGISS
jgi:hypothetical protein